MKDQTQRAQAVLEASEPRQGDMWSITPRGFIVGCLMAATIAIAVPYGGMVIQGSRLGLSACTPAAFFLFFVFLLTVQVVLGVLNRAWLLKPGELIVVFIMMTMATAIPTRGVVGMLLPMITGTFYFATPENNWAELIHPFLQDWMVLFDADAVKGFYEGTSSEIPWGLWAPLLLRWLLFFAAFHLTFLCSLAILRRQWVEHQRLVFPLAQVPLAMIQAGEKADSIVKPFFKNPVMWVGFLLSFCLNSTNALHHYFESIPALMTQFSTVLFRDHVPLSFRINFLMFGFAYFIGSNISFSLWFFYVLHLIQVGVFNIVGITNPEKLGHWTDSGPVGAIIAHQMMGALTVLVLFGLWTGRSHIKEVLWKAWDKNAPVDDSREIMSYRFAVFGFLVGIGTMWVFLWKTGIPAWIVPLFIFAALIIWIGLARAVAEAGIPTITPAIVPAGFVISTVGVPALGIKGMVATGMTLTWGGDLLAFITAPMTNAIRLGSEVTRHRRVVFSAMATALLISLVLSACFLVYLAYRDGALNLHSQYFTGFARAPSQLAVMKLNAPTGPNLVGWLWTGAGGLIMAALMFARHFFVWWPFHPIGFAASASWALDATWLSIFFAWLIKVIVLQFGGPTIYEKTKPFFMGIIMGQFVVGGFWVIVDAFTGMRGNVIRVY